jgi:transcription-repair coupling factor (superfamily II helicase)
MSIRSLTATPIPRTLQFSLMAARDLSVITTPPPNRYPIETNVVGFSEEVIRAISYEIQRNGQVSLSITALKTSEVAGMILVLGPPEVLVTDKWTEKLEELMLALERENLMFWWQTTIIESGLDVPNANTILSTIFQKEPSFEQFSEFRSGFNIAMKDLRFVVPEIYWVMSKVVYQRKRF